MTRYRCGDLGRDTLCSQITVGEDSADPPGGERRLSIPPNKQSPADIYEKFGKFEIKSVMESMCSTVPPNQIHKLYWWICLRTSYNNVEDLTVCVIGDETVSLLSDTWSTEVLASDSETVKDNRQARMIMEPDNARLEIPLVPVTNENSSDNVSGELMFILSN